MINILKVRTSLFSNSVVVSSVRSVFDTKSLFNEVKTGASNSNLFKLRKATGYGMSKCKEALEKCSGNVEQATKWLDEQAQKEGWTKAEKLKNRKTAQGTLVMFADKSKHKCALIEMNCETDFVARNEKFIDLSSQLAISVLENAKTDASKCLLNKDELSKLAFVNSPGRTIGDQIALSIGSLGENMSLKRAVVFNIKEGEHLSWYMHGSLSEPLNNCHFGKYGALVTLSLTQRNENYKVPFDIGRQIAQHIVGMKPTSIGELPTSSDPQPAAGEKVKIDENETRLLYQEFLMKPETRVLDFLNENFAKVNDFIRFECGESTEKDEA